LPVSKQVAQLSQRDGAAGCVNFCQKWDWNWDTIFYGYHTSIFNHCGTIGEQSYRIRWKKRKGLLRRSRLFKVNEVGTNRKPVCDFLLVINSNW